VRRASSRIRTSREPTLVVDLSVADSSVLRCGLAHLLFTSCSATSFALPQFRGGTVDGAPRLDDSVKRATFLRIDW